MAWMPDSEFKQEHTTLPRILRTGTKAEREAEADKQELEGKAMAEKKSEEKKEVENGHGIRRVEIEPAESGGFIVTVVHKPKEGKKGEMSMSMGEEPDKHICANVGDLSDFLGDCFPMPKTRSRKGKSETKESGGSRVDTYESEQGDEEGY